MDPVNYTKKKDNKIYVSKELVQNITSDYLYDEIHKQYGYDYLTHDDFCEINRSFGNADSEPINIDNAIKILTELKEKGVENC